MKIKIGHVELNGNTELESRFETGTYTTDWCGPKIKIASIDIYLELYCNAYTISNSKDKSSTVNVQRHVHFVITDVKGRSIKRTESVKKLQEVIADKKFGYCCGWADGPTRVVIREDALGLIQDNFNVQASA